MKKLYLHMGFHKTGTTSFQHTCALNREKLLAQDYEYPLFFSKYTEWDDISNHGVPLCYLYKDPAKVRMLNAKDSLALEADYLNTLENALKTANKLIISGEDIMHIEDNNLEILKKKFEEYSFEIIPIILVRSPYEFNCTWRNHVIACGPYCNEHFFATRSDVIEKIKKVFPNTKFFAFREACKHEKGLVGFLFDQIGVDYKDFEILRKNEGMLNFTTRVQNKLNQKVPALINDEINPYYIKLQNPPIQEGASLIARQKYLLSEEEFNIIQEKYKAENNYFKEHLGEEFTDKNIEFVQKDERIELLESLIEVLSKKDYPTIALTVQLINAFEGDFLAKILGRK